jgi:uncharacterized membrane protein (DUF373 family)
MAWGSYPRPLAPVPRPLSPIQRCGPSPSAHTISVAQSWCCSLLLLARSVGVGDSTGGRSTGTTWALWYAPSGRWMVGAREDQVAAPVERKHDAAHRIEAVLQSTRHWLSLGQDLILVAVAIILLLAGVYVLFEGMADVVHAFATRGQLGETTVGIVENALLALILAELVGTLLVTLGGARLTPEPFLMVAMVAVIREMLLTAVVAPPIPEVGALLPSATRQQLALGLLVLMLGGVLALVRARRARED